VQFDRPIATFPAVGGHLADGETIRLVTWRLSKNLTAHNAITTAKFRPLDGGQRVARATAHARDGTGIDVDHPVHRILLPRNEVSSALAARPHDRAASA
jgi:3-oxocholest-4-en-26-oyl-CoA dehydrogenase beta subunit